MAHFDITAKKLRALVPQLKAGDTLGLTGTLYTSRDAAHKEIFALLDQGKPLPFELEDAIIYYAGPTPGKPGMAVGSCGPTTSGRMDSFAPRLYDLGLLATIGKGSRSEQVRVAIAKNRGLYLLAVGGAGALIARCIKRAEEIGFVHLGCESVKRLEVENLPLIVGIDPAGDTIV